MYICDCLKINEHWTTQIRYRVKEKREDREMKIVNDAAAGPGRLHAVLLEKFIATSVDKTSCFYVNLWLFPMFTEAPVRFCWILHFVLSKLTLSFHRILGIVLRSSDKIFLCFPHSHYAYCVSKLSHLCSSALREWKSPYLRYRWTHRTFVP
jgi:hypothetical protein